MEIQEHGDICDMIGIHLGWKKNSTEKIQVRPANEVTTSVRPIIITIRDCYPNNRLLSHNHSISTPPKFENSISNPKNGDRKIIFHGLFIMAILGVPPKFTG